MRSKYGARKTVIDGIRFDSAKEARYYCELKLRKIAGEIVDFERQALFTHIVNGVKCFRYYADFVEYYPDGTRKVVDVKGYKKNPVYRIKKKCIEAQYGIVIHEA